MEVVQQVEQFQTLQTQIVAVSFTPPGRVKAYLERYPLPFPAVSDPELKGYRTFSLERTTWGRILHPRMLLRYLGYLFRGWLPKKNAPDEDVLQLGGDFVIDAEGRLVYAHRSADPTDRPAVSELLSAVKNAA